MTGVVAVGAVFGVLAVAGVTAVGSSVGSAVTNVPAVASLVSEPVCTDSLAVPAPLPYPKVSTPLANAATGLNATAAAPPASIHFVLVNIVVLLWLSSSARRCADEDQTTCGR